MKATGLGQRIRSVCWCLSQRPAEDRGGIETAALGRHRSIVPPLPERQDLVRLWEPLIEGGDVRPWRRQDVERDEVSAPRAEEGLMAPGRSADRAPRSRRDAPHRQRSAGRYSVCVRRRPLPPRSARAGSVEHGALSSSYEALQAAVRARLVLRLPAKDFARLHVPAPRAVWVMRSVSHTLEPCFLSDACSGPPQPRATLLGRAEDRPRARDGHATEASPRPARGWRGYLAR